MLIQAVEPISAASVDCIGKMRETLTRFDAMFLSASFVFPSTEIILGRIRAEQIS